MKPIFKTCDTCKGSGRVKKSIFGEIYELEEQTAWSEEIGAYVELKECDCPECEGSGVIDFTDDYYLNKADEQIKNRKEL